MTVQKLYRGQDRTILTKYEIGGKSLTLDQIATRFAKGARGVLNNPVVDGYVKDGVYLIDSWPRYDSYMEMVAGWIDLGYPANWYYIYTDDNGVTMGCHRFIGQVTRLFYVKGDKIEWINHDSWKDPGTGGWRIPDNQKEWLA